MLLLPVPVGYASQTQNITLRLGERTAVLSVPSRLPHGDIALLLVFHGAGGNAKQMLKQTGFNAMA